MRNIVTTGLLALALLAALPPTPAQAQVGEEVPFITTPDNVTPALLKGQVKADRLVLEPPGPDGRGGHSGRVLQRTAAAACPS